MSEEEAVLRAALRFYADEQHWHTTVLIPDGTYPGRSIPAPGAREITIPGGEIIAVTAIEQDHGERARKALAPRLLLTNP